MGIFKVRTERAVDTGFDETMEYDYATDQIITHRRFDNEPLLRKNAEMRNADDGYTKDRTWRRVASISPGIAEAWLKHENVNIYDDADMPKVLALLDSKEWSQLKTSDGHLSKKPLRSYVRGSFAPVMESENE